MSSLRNNYYRIASPTPTNRVRRLTDDGTGLTGIHKIIDDYSVTPKDFWIQPPIGNYWVIQEIGLIINRQGTANIDDYGIYLED